MPTASSKTVIHAPVDAIWQVISDFGAACRYLAMVEDCSVAGQGVGSLRTLTNADGTTIVECLEALDEIAHRLSYALLTDTPFSNCLTTVSVRDLGPSDVVGDLRGQRDSGERGRGAACGRVRAEQPGPAALPHCQRALTG